MSLALKLCAISVDLDEIPYYHAIYGLPEPAPAVSGLVMDLGVRRLSDFARSHGVPMTWFTIGKTVDSDHAAAAAQLRVQAERGDEIANHTFSHNYRFTRLEREVVEREVVAAQDVIAESTGQRPTGFRAPGYTVTDQLLDILQEHGFTYDSSVFPSPAYYAAKAAAVTLLAIGGRRSQSIVDTPHVLRAPCRPYRVGRPYWERGSGIVELPLQVTRGARLPYIGTSVLGGGVMVAKVLTRMVVGEPLVNLELHGIDALDARDGLEELGRHARDLLVPHARKLDALAAAVELLRKSGYSFVRLDEAARSFAG